MLPCISERFRKTWPLGFRLDSGEARIQAKPASQNPRGALSRLAWVHSPGLELFAGGLSGSQSPCRGDGRGPLPVGTVFETLRTSFCEFCLILWPIGSFRASERTRCARATRLGQSWDNLVHRGVFWPWYPSEFAKTWPLGFREARIQATPGSQNPRGAPSRLAWVHSPGLELSAGGLSGVQLSKTGGRGGCVLLTPFAVLSLRF